MHKVVNMTTIEELKNRIEKLYFQWSESGLNEYQKLTLKHLEAEYRLLQKEVHK